MNSRVMKKSGKRLLALLLSMLMIVSMLSVAMISASATLSSAWIYGGFNSWSYTNGIKASSGTDSNGNHYWNLGTVDAYDNSGNSRFFRFKGVGDNNYNGSIAPSTDGTNKPLTTTATKYQQQGYDQTGGGAFYIDTSTITNRSQNIILHMDQGTWSVWYTLEGGTTPTQPSEDPTDPEGTVKIYFPNPNHWSNVYVYVYDEKVTPKVENGIWPGVKMTSSTAYPGYWEYTVPDNLKNSANTQVVFNSGTGSQIPGQNQPGYMLSKSTHSYKDDDWVEGPPSGVVIPTEPTEATRPAQPDDVQSGGDGKPLHYISADLFNYYYDSGESHDGSNGNNRYGNVTNTFNNAISDYFSSNSSNAKSQTIWGYSSGTATAGWEAYTGPEVTASAPSGRPNLLYFKASGYGDTLTVWAYNSSDSAHNAYIMNKISGSNYYYAYIPADRVNVIFINKQLSSGQDGSNDWNSCGLSSGTEIARSSGYTTSKPLYNTQPAIPHTTKTQSALTPLYFGTFWPNKKGDESLMNSTLWHKYMPAQMADRKDGDTDKNTSMHAVAQGLVDNKLNNDGMLTQLGIVMPYFDSSFLAKTTSGTSQGTLGASYLTWFPMNVSEQYGIKEYYYDSLNNKNRYLNTSNTEKMQLSSSAVNNLGDGKSGYFPFSSSNSNRKFASGTKLEVDFYMAEDGVIKGNGGNKDMKFNFSGDDDVWVFVDGYLVMDMGGAHCAASGTVDFTTLSSTVKTTSADYAGLTGGKGTAGGYLATYQGSDKNDTSASDYSAYSTYEFPEELKARLKDYANPHKLTFYYMERGFRDSNMKITYTLPETPQVTTVNVKEHTDFSTINDALLLDAKRTAYNFHSFAYDVEGDRSNEKHGIVDYRTYEYGVRKFSEDSESEKEYLISEMTGATRPVQGADFEADGVMTPLNNKFQMVPYALEDDQNGDGLPEVTGANSTAVSADDGYDRTLLPLMYNQKASFVYQFALNIADKQSNVMIGQHKNLVKPDENSSTFYEGSWVNGSVMYLHTEKAVSDFYNTSWKLTKNEDEVVKEQSDASYNNDYIYVNDGTGNTFKNNETGAAGSNTAIYTAEFDNKAKAYNISVTKRVESDSNIPDDQGFPFYIDFAGIFSGDDYSSSAQSLTNDDFKAYRISYTKSSEPEVIRYTRVIDGKASFNLKKDETATFTGIPAGTTYRIYEANTLERREGTDTFIYNYKNAEFTNGSGTKGELKDGDITYKSVYGTTSSDVAVDFTNGAQKLAYQVAYAYHERHVENGQPTYVDNSQYVLSNIMELEEPLDNNYANILKNAPDVKNIVDKYFLTADHVEEADLSKVLCKSSEVEDYYEQCWKVGDLVCNPNNYAGKPNDTSDKIVVDNDNNLIIVYLGNSSQRYTVTYTVPDANGNETTKLYTTKKYNDLVKSGDITAPKSVDGRGNFLYWAVEKFEDPIDGYMILNPISTQNEYRYRITDNMSIYAVYEEDIKPYGNYSTDGKVAVVSNLNENADGADSSAGYGAVTLNTVYDKYVDYNKNNKVRMNVMVGAVGSPDVDKNITSVGYVRIQNRADGNYNINNYTTVSHDDLLYFIQSDGQRGISNAVLKQHSVGGHLSPDIDDPYPDTGGTNTSINLTNKNRANFVFTMTNSSEYENRYYTVYTYVVRTNSSGEEEYFISPTPSFISLKDPNCTGKTLPSQPTDYSYTINASVNYEEQEDSNSYRVPSIRTSAALVNGNERVKITARVPSDESSNQYDYKLDNIKIGNNTYTVANGDITEVFSYSLQSYGLSYVLNYYVDPNDVINGNINVVANFSKFTAPTAKTVKVKVIGHGSVKIENSYNSEEIYEPDENGIITIPAGGYDTYCVVMTPEEGWELSQVDDSSATLSQNIYDNKCEINSIALSYSPLTAINLRVVFTPKNS